MHALLFVILVWAALRTSLVPKPSADLLVTSTQSRTVLFVLPLEIAWLILDCTLSGARCGSSNGVNFKTASSFLMDEQLWNQASGSISTRIVFSLKKSCPSNNSASVTSPWISFSGSGFLGVRGGRG